ncbi:hypothetical protein BC833DRAFT_606133 [Globomyces pollinis-pini]|nr:hypothetical protein BC833DRAFT_606133 [Globomyces pollinis-pini]
MDDFNQKDNTSNKPTRRPSQPGKVNSVDDNSGTELVKFIRKTNSNEEIRREHLKKDQSHFRSFSNNVQTKLEHLKFDKITGNGSGKLRGSMTVRETTKTKLLEDELLTTTNKGQKKSALSSSTGILNEKDVNGKEKILRGFKNPLLMGLQNNTKMNTVENNTLLMELTTRAMERDSNNNLSSSSNRLDTIPLKPTSPPLLKKPTMAQRKRTRTVNALEAPEDYHDLINRIQTTYKKTDELLMTEPPIEDNKRKNTKRTSLLPRGTVKKVFPDMQVEDILDTEPSVVIIDVPQTISTVPFKIGIESSPKNAMFKVFNNNQSLQWKKFSYENELEILNFKEDLEQTDFESYFSLNESADHLAMDTAIEYDDKEISKKLESNLADLWKEPEPDYNEAFLEKQFEVRTKRRSTSFFKSGIPSQTQIHSYSSQSQIHGHSSQSQLNSGVSYAKLSGLILKDPNRTNHGMKAMEWASKVKTSFVKNNTRQPKKSSFVIPLESKEYVDPAILFAEKQMEAWEALKNEMFNRTGGSRTNKFKNFKNVILVIQGLRKLGMNPNLLNRVDKSTLRIVIAIKLWKKRALENRMLRNEPLRNLISTFNNQSFIQVPKSIQNQVWSDSIEIIELFLQQYRTYLGEDHIKTIATAERMEVLLSKLLPQFCDDTVSIEIQNLNNLNNPITKSTNTIFKSRKPTISSFLNFFRSSTSNLQGQTNEDVNTHYPVSLKTPSSFNGEDYGESSPLSPLSLSPPSLFPPFRSEQRDNLPLSPSSITSPKFPWGNETKELRQVIPSIIPHEEQTKRRTSSGSLMIDHRTSIVSVNARNPNVLLTPIKSIVPTTRE